VAAKRLDAPRTRIQFGDSVPIEVAVKLNGLTPADVRVELILSREPRETPQLQHSHELAAGGIIDEGAQPAEIRGWQRFSLELKPGLSGRLDYRVRIFPRHELLTHPFELGLMTWL
jgi:starch phosphorylase